MESINDNENYIEETLEPQSHGGSLKREKKIDGAGIAYYGESFSGYQKIGEYRDLIPAFKEFFYQAHIKNPESKVTHILRAFNREVCEPIGRKFHPYTTNVGQWKKKWEKDILAQRGMMVETITTDKRVQQVLKTRASEGNGVVQYEAPTYENIEQGLQTLAGELTNDALQMMRDDQALEDIYDSDELIKRKTYITNVFGHVTKMVHGKASLMLKASQEKRENAGFLMELMKKATSGKMGVAEIAALRTTYQPNATPVDTQNVG